MAADSDDPLATRTGWISALYRYPVKSMGGEVLITVEAGESFRGDRAYGVLDATTGRLLSAKTEPRLLEATAKYRDDGEVSITIPQGGGFSTSTSSDFASCDDDLSDWLLRRVRLVRPESGERRTIDIDDVNFEGEAAVTRFSFDSPPGRFVDSAPLHVLTTASLRAAKQLYPDGVWDEKRFRPNVVIEVNPSSHFVEGFVEDSWVGRRLDVGAMEIEVTKPCVRCILVTRAFPGPTGESVAADLDILRTLYRHHQSNLGVKAVVTGVGLVSIGDSVFLR